jgi:predicted RNA-binding Zn-ribbon protein involved in translation (DUF1610 family)
MTANYECIPLDDIIAALERDDMTGFCLSCHAESQGVEPDATKYPCESCGENKVFGAEEILLHVQA